MPNSRSVAMMISTGCIPIRVKRPNGATGFQHVAERSSPGWLQVLVRACPHSNEPSSKLQIRRCRLAADDKADARTRLELCVVGDRLPDSEPSSLTPKWTQRNSQSWCKANQRTDQSKRCQSARDKSQNSPSCATPKRPIRTHTHNHEPE